MKGMPLISVVIPVYNEESYVSDLIKSIKQQTYKNYEIIAADSSTDNTPNILKKLNVKIVTIQKQTYPLQEMQV
jgi:glycosyltransferase involved in cell wall biosynthesis